MNEKVLFSLIICHGQAGFYQKQQHWVNKPLNLEAVNSITSSEDLNQLLQKLNDSLNKENELADVELVILYASDSIQYLEKVPEQLAKLKCTSWQVLYWEAVCKRAIAVALPQNADNAHQEETWLVNTLLPLLEGTLHYQDDAWLAERRRAQDEHEESLSSLKKDRIVLEEKIASLNQQIKNLRSYDLEQLLVFLPIIYRNFWSKIKPSDLALISGSLKIPEVASPFPEPDAHTLLTMKQRLQKLPQENREQLRDFCSQLPHTLDVRPEMRFFFNEA